MIIRDATPEDLARVAETSISRGIKEHPPTIDYVYAVEHEGEILCVGGVKMMNPSSAWVWVDMSAFATTHLIMTYRSIRDWMEEMMEVHGIQRLMAAVVCDFNEAIRMAEHLGFKCESVLRKWKNDKDAFMYVKFKEKT